MIGDIETVRALLSQGADPNEIDVDANSAIVYAAERGDTAMVRLLLERNADSCLLGTSWQGTALWMASSNGHPETITALLESVAGYDNEADTTDRTRLRERLKALLLGHTADFNVQQDFTKQTPLMEAADENHLSLAKLLLEAGADVNYQDSCDCTALMYAAKQGHFEMVQILLQAGARCNVKNAMGISILEEAIGGGHTEVEEFLRSVGALEGWVRLPDSPDVS